MTDVSLLISAAIWAFGTLAILVFVVYEIFDARYEWRAILRLNLNGAMRRTSLYVRKAAYADLVQVVCYVIIVVLALAADKAYGAFGPTGDVLYRNVIRGVLIVSLLPMFYRVWERFLLRRDTREAEKSRG